MRATVPAPRARLRPALGGCVSILLFLFLAAGLSPGAAQAQAPPVPVAVASTHFTVQVGGVSSQVVHAAAGYYLLNFNVSGPVEITVTAADPHYWDRGVEVQPMRWGIRPRRNGASIAFPLAGPAKLSITRPGDHFADSEMLFLFANAPELERVTASTPGVRYYGSGVHRGDLDAKDGDRIYLAERAVVFGGLTLWQVHDVHVAGRGMLVYDGPQDPNSDTGWIHKPGRHGIVMDDARDIDIEGITVVVRSRTWMIQMRDTRRVRFHNVKVIGDSPGNANQDGMDWLGGGDTLVEDCFFRAADDIFAMYGNWDGYTEDALTTPGSDVSNITVERSVLSTSVSNVVRANWPKKVFNSSHFTLRDSDVIHAGAGSCGVPFAVMEIWADPAGKELQTGYTLEDLRLEDWYSLVQLRQPNPAVRDVRFANITAMDGPGLAASVLKGDVQGVSFDEVNLGGGAVLQNGDVPLEASEGAAEPTYKAGSNPAFSYSAGLLRPGAPVTFTASGFAPASHLRWLFGDG